MSQVASNPLPTLGGGMAGKEVDWSALDEPEWTDKDVQNWIRDLRREREAKQPAKGRKEQKR